MRIAIIGAGAVGGTIAALLHKNGHDVEVTARGEHLAAMRENGLQLTGAWGDHNARVDANPVITKAPGLAIVTTKAQDAPAALRENSRWLSGIPILIVQNGMDALTNAEEVVDRSDVIGGLALYAASYLSPGSVSVTTAGPTYLGTRESSLALEYVAGILGGAMPVTVTHNFAGAQWTKLIVNQINALPAITGLAAQTTIAHPKLRRILTASMREAVGVALAQGVHFAALQGLSHGALRLFHLLPPGIGQLLPLIMKWRMGSTPNPGSTLQSIRRGQLTEIDYLNGAIVAAGSGHSVPTPVNAALVAMVHDVERTGSFLSIDDVVDRATIG